MLRTRTIKLCAIKDFQGVRFISTVEPLPHYPPIENLSKSEKLRKDYVEKLKRLPTVEEKTIEINITKYYGYFMNMLNESVPFGRHSNFVQFVTKTNLLRGWPDSVNNNAASNEVLPLFKENLKKVLTSELDDRLSSSSREALNKSRTESLIRSVHRAMTSTLCNDFDHIASYQTDLDARLDAFWFCGGIPPTIYTDDEKKIERIKFHQSNVARPMQTTSVRPLLVRSAAPLPPFADCHHPAAVQGSPIAESWRYPADHGCYRARRHGTITIGHWPGTQHKFSPLAFSCLNWIQNIQDKCLTKMSLADYNHCVMSQGCLHGFSSALAQAAMNGFFPFLPLTYPVCNFQIMTDGFKWFFFAYQLNTIEQLHEDPVEGTPSNICWSHEPLDLFLEDSCDVEKLNDEVLLKLLQIYMTVPSSDGIDNLAPYLDPQHNIESVEDDWMRKRFMQNFFHLMANRKRALLKPEIYMWERIYKLMFNTRPLDARKRFYELKLDPSKRRLDDIIPPYIPKALRPPNLTARQRKEWIREKNIYHEMSRLRGLRNDQPQALQELEELSRWKK